MLNQVTQYFYIFSFSLINLTYKVNLFLSLLSEKYCLFHLKIVKGHKIVLLMSLRNCKRHNKKRIESLNLTWKVNLSKGFDTKYICIWLKFIFAHQNSLEQSFKPVFEYKITF
jgi:hypothetical protein